MGARCCSSSNVVCYSGRFLGNMQPDISLANSRFQILREMPQFFDVAGWCVAARRQSGARHHLLLAQNTENAIIMPHKSIICWTSRVGSTP
jgi:hypothetical protein